MEDPALRQKYKKCKYVAKMWEKDFQRKRGTIPSKYDIQDAPRKIRDAYKLYYQLKKSFLDESKASEMCSEDGFDSALEISQDTSIASQTIPEIPELPDMTQPLNVWGDEVSKRNMKKPIEIDRKATLKSTTGVRLNTELFTNISFSKRNPRKYLSRTTSMPGKSMSNFSFGSDAGADCLPDLETILIAKAEQYTKQTRPVVTPVIKEQQSSLTNKVDKGWLNRHLSESSLAGFGMMDTSPTAGKDSFGLSNVNTEVFRHFSSPNMSMSQISSVVEQQKVLPVTSSIIVSLNLIEQPEKTIPPVVPIENETNNLPVPSNNKTAANDSDSVVENSEDESPKRRFEARAILKRRKVETESELSNSVVVTAVATKTTALDAVASVEEPEKTSEKKKRTRKRKSKLDSDDENTDDGDEEFQVKQKRKVKSQKSSRPRKTKASEGPAKTARPKRELKRKNLPRTSKAKTEEQKEESTDEVGPSELPFAFDSKQLTSLPSVNMNELNEAEDVIKKYLFDDGNGGTKTTTCDMQPHLRERAAEDNLASNVALGRANENFVRINLKKKVFVRGKKTMNFSKYKKNLWKQKKESALCGPDMDMRGCDGGTLTCFKCGKTGHFVRNCPVKGDTLLPVKEHEVDESPFPTLEEAELMAKEKAIAVHSKNIDKLPIRSNEMLYKDSECLSEKENLDNDVDVEMQSVDSAVAVHNKETPIAKRQIGKTYIGHKVPVDFLKKAGLARNETTSDQKAPIYDLAQNGTVIEPTKEVYDVLKMFGHTDFRKGQEKAIMRILSGVSTLVTLSTGSGKSLCYQLPAYLYSKKKRCITLVVSPLVSLMEDQVHGVPVFLNAQCLHTNQTPTQKQQVLEAINNGMVDILLVSPEAIVAGERSTGFGSILRNLPPIAFACIDEVHCVSQWSHNFRPSYLMICKVLKTKLGVKTILGLTATATFQTREGIIKHLNIPDGIQGVICDVPLPDNLYLTASKDEHRDHALVKLLRSDRFAECQSIIVYCTRRDECERVATFVRTCLQDTQPAGLKVGKRKRINWCAEPYHAGMAASRRITVQKAFMSNELRIVVATVAFGMGINKPDIRAVIHYNMPKTFESYVQEVGRAGRDGLPAHCHLFLDSHGSDQNELRRHIFANSIDRHVIRKLLQKVFVPCCCNKNIEKKEFLDEYAEEIEAVQSIDWEEDYFTETKKTRKRVCPGHEIGIPVAETVDLLDIPEENISTLLCYLELDGRWSLKTLSNAYIMCKIISYGGATAIKKAAKDCPPLAMAIALEIKKGQFDHSSNIFEFSVIEIASAIGWNSGVVKYQLKNLEWTTVNGLPRRSHITVSYHELGFRIQSPGDFTDDELDEALDVLYNRAVHQEKTQLLQLQQVFEGLSSVACSSYAQCTPNERVSNSTKELKTIIREYFKHDLVIPDEISSQVDTSCDDQIAHDVQRMFGLYPENNFTGRSLARIFHGIQSPNYPALMWSRCKYWRAHFKIDFNHIVRLANAVIVEMRR